MSVTTSLPLSLNISCARLSLNQRCFSVSKSSCSPALQNNLKPAIAFRSPTPQRHEKRHEKHMRNRASHTDVRSPEIRSLIGYLAPDFEAEAIYNEEFVKVKLSSYIGKKYVIIFFYPLDFTLVCPTEITAFSDKYAEFQKLDTEILAISTDSVTDRKSGGLGKLSYPLVSDLTKNVAKSFRVLLPEQGIALRGLFIIDKQGIIQHGTINNFAIGRSVDEALRLLQAIQHVQSHPSEVCPANWQPGDKAIKPDGHCPPMCGV